MDTNADVTRIIKEIKGSPFLGMFSRFDVHHKNVRVYGRVRQDCVLLQSIYLAERFRGKGIFTELVKQLKREFKKPVQVQSVENERLFQHLKQSIHWKQIDKQTFETV